MKKISLLFLLIITHSSFAQTDSLQVKEKNCAKNTLFAELLGNGGLFSLNYDRIIKEKKNHKLSIRGGISLSLLTNWTFGDKDYINTSYNPIPFAGGLNDSYICDGLFDKSLIFPTEINYLIGKKCFFEMGGGLTGDIHLIKNMYGTRLYLFTRIAGFRYQRENGGFFFRAGLVPSFKIFLYKNEFLFDPLRYYFSIISFDFGYTFKNKHEK
jgi:hypothetical protein